MENKVLGFLKTLAKPLVIIYIIIFAYYCLGFSPGKGDELLFINDLALIKESGWYAAIAKSISIPYMILAYPFSFLFKDYIALRLVNVLLLIALLYYFKSKEIKNGFYWLFIFFAATAGGHFFAGTNDPVFFIGLIVFFYEVYLVSQNGKWNSNLALIALLVSIFSRALILVYIPVILFSLYVIYREGAFKKRDYKYVIAFFAILMVLNIPSLIANGRLSYDLKSPPQNTTATWTQRQYLAQLMVNKGELANLQHPTWEETDKYLEINGENSLPKGIVEGMLFDVELTIKEFFKDFAFIGIYGFRQLSFVFFLPFFFICYAILKKSFDLNKLYIPIVYLSVMLIFALIIISYVELRWLFPVFVLAIVYYSDKEGENGTIMNRYSILNYCGVLLFSIYGIYNLSTKLF